jgi:hypothetical protein
MTEEWEKKTIFSCLPFVLPKNENEMKTLDMDHTKGGICFE